MYTQVSSVQSDRMRRLSAHRSPASPDPPDNPCPDKRRPVLLLLRHPAVMPAAGWVRPRAQLRKAATPARPAGAVPVRLAVLRNPLNYSAPRHDGVAGARAATPGVTMLARG